MTELKRNLTTEEKELMQNPIDRWGQEWRKPPQLIMFCEIAE